MTLIIAHRGGGNRKKGPPENSLAAFRQCIEMGVDGIELDLQLTADGAVAVLHDAQLARMTGAPGVIAETTTSGLATLRLQDGRHGIPLLDDVLDLVAGTDLELHLELKTDHKAEPYAGLAATVSARLAAHGIADDRLIFTSFQPQLLAEMRALRPGCRVEAAISLLSAGMLGGLTAAIAAFAPFEGCLYSINEPLLEPSFEACRAAVGVERLGVWTVNDADDVWLWIDRGVRHIITDRPALALAARAA